MVSTVSTKELNYSFNSTSLPRKVGFFTVLKNSFIKDIQIQMRYKQNFVAQFIRTLAFILIFYLFSLSFAFDDLPNQDVSTVFLFYISGLMLMMYDGTALWTPYNTVRRDLYNGTLETIYQSPGSRFAYYLGGVSANAIYSSVFVLPLFITALIISQPELQTITMVLTSIAIALATLMSMGIIIGLTAILFKNTGALINILGMVFQFATGTIIPFASLPTWAQIVGYVFPITWGLDLIRYYLFQGLWVPIYPVSMMWAILIGQLLFFLLLSRFLLNRVENYSKKKGLHLL